MDIDGPNNLSPEEEALERDEMERFAVLFTKERSRYEVQAKELIAKGSFIYRSSKCNLIYSIRGDRYICDANPRDALSKSFSIEFPIPTSPVDQIEVLVELFAQSEAGLGSL